MGNQRGPINFIVIKKGGDSIKHNRDYAWNEVEGII